MKKDKCKSISTESEKKELQKIYDEEVRSELICTTVKMREELLHAIRPIVGKNVSVNKEQLKVFNSKVKNVDAYLKENVRNFTNRLCDCIFLLEELQKMPYVARLRFYQATFHIFDYLRKSKVLGREYNGDMPERVIHVLDLLDSIDEVYGGKKIVKENAQD